LGLGQYVGEVCELPARVSAWPFAASFAETDQPGQRAVDIDVQGRALEGPAGSAHRDTGDLLIRANSALDISDPPCTSLPTTAGRRPGTPKFRIG